jgi:nucleoside phosphorylase
MDLWSFQTLLLSLQTSSIPHHHIPENRPVAVRFSNAALRVHYCLCSLEILHISKVDRGLIGAQLGYHTHRPIPSEIMVLNPADYKVVWIAPLRVELEAALEIYDERYEDSFPVEPGDGYVFYAGRIYGLNVAIASLPTATPYGTASAAALVSQVRKFFRNPWLVLLVGIAAGLPHFSSNPPRDIRLGDILIAVPEGNTPAIVSYELGKETEDGFELLRSGHHLASAEGILMSAIDHVRYTTPGSATHFLSIFKKFHSTKFDDPGLDKDILYDAHQIPVQRSARSLHDRTRAWEGPIGSGDKLMKTAKMKDEMMNKFRIIGLEMEGAGTNRVVNAVMIRGVCDYGDRNKNDEWQPFAAARAASYAKEMLSKIQPPESIRNPIDTEHKVLGGMKAASNGT